MTNELSHDQATELVRMLTPVGGVKPSEPELVERARQCRRLYDHLRAHDLYLPRWLQEEVSHVC